jgi:hypothetical protein
MTAQERTMQIGLSFLFAIVGFLLLLYGFTQFLIPTLPTFVLGIGMGSMGCILLAWSLVAYWDATD